MSFFINYFIRWKSIPYIHKIEFLFNKLKHVHSRIYNYLKLFKSIFSWISNTEYHIYHILDVHDLYILLFWLTDSMLHLKQKQLEVHKSQLSRVTPNLNLKLIKLYYRSSAHHSYCRIMSIWIDHIFICWFFEHLHGNKIRGKFIWYRHKGIRRPIVSESIVFSLSNNIWNKHRTETTL